MPRFSLRTLIVVMLLGGPVCAWGYREWQAHSAREAERVAREEAANRFGTLDFQFKCSQFGSINAPAPAKTPASTSKN